MIQIMLALAGLVERVEVLAQRANDALAAGELAEDVLDHDDRLLHDVVDLGLDELEQHVDAPPAAASLMAHRPMARTARRTNSTSTSVEYSETP